MINEDTNGETMSPESVDPENLDNPRLLRQDLEV